MRIGAKFHADLLAADARTDGLAWTASGELVYTDTPTPWTEVERAAVEAVLAAHDPDAADITAEWIALRAERDARLITCDWTQLPDSPLTAEARNAWATYRQALRDLPALTTDPASPIWPEAPL
ncbi:MAG: tail fiber assembly protein [Rhodospirillaceae bacterium]